MSDLLAKCDWNGDVLLLTLPQDPSSIHVRLFDSERAPKKEYIPKSEYRKMERWYNENLVAEITENKRLRELATLNWEWARSCCGNNCRMQTDVCGYGIDRECNFEREIYERMHELGIEVDE